MAYCVVPQRNFVAQLQMKGQTHGFSFEKHYEKKKVFCNWPCNSNLSCIRHLQLTIYIVQLITTQLQLCCNNSFSTTMQLPYDYNHNVILMSFFIHLSKFNTWHYDIHRPLWSFVLNDLGLWHVTQSKVATWHINWILETIIYMYLSRSVHSHR